MSPKGGSRRQPPRAAAFFFLPMRVRRLCLPIGNQISTNDGACESNGHLL